MNGIKSRGAMLSTTLRLLRSSAVAALVVPLASAATNDPPLGTPNVYTRADIEHGARVYAEHCDRCHGASGNGVSGIDLRSGTFRNAPTDQQLATVISIGIPFAGMPSFTLDAADLTGLVAYLRNMTSVDAGSVKHGDAARGRLIVETKGQCLICHRINGSGSRKGPDLSDIGANRTAGSIERSLTDSTAQMWPINRPVHIVTTDGKTIEARRLNEDSYTVQVVNQDGDLISLDKCDLRELTASSRSPMPSYKDELSPEELDDVVTYLLTLKGY